MHTQTEKGARILKSTLIGKEVTITEPTSIHYGDWGIVKDFDGEYYYVAMFNDESDMPVFIRDEFRVRRK